MRVVLHSLALFAAAKAMRLQVERGNRVGDVEGESIDADHPSDAGARSGRKWSWDAKRSVAAMLTFSSQLQGASEAWSLPPLARSSPRAELNSPVAAAIRPPRSRIRSSGSPDMDAAGGEPETTVTTFDGGAISAPTSQVGVIEEAKAEVVEDGAAGELPAEITPAMVFDPDSPAIVAKKIPVTMLSGFLGTGKTTLLKHLLENTEGVRIGVVVNDVAAINVDSKLVKQGASQENIGNLEDMVELSNGCACCSAGDDLLSALADLVTTSVARGIEYDHIVFEASGVAEPRLLRDMFQRAQMAGLPLMNWLSLETMVTVVDAGSFYDLYSSTESVRERRDLGSDDMSNPDKALEVAPSDTSVVSLLVEQVETADVLVLNKVDNLDNNTLGELKDILTTINGFAALMPTTFGKVSPTELLVKQRESGVAMSNEIMDHQSAVDLAKWLEKQIDVQRALLTAPKEEKLKANEEAARSHDHDHDHDHKHEHKHDHDHDHEHDHDHKAEHKHDHDHKAEHKHDHDHDHEHDHDHKAEHKHDHDHKAEHKHGHDHDHDHDHGHNHAHGHSHDHDHSHHDHDHDHDHDHACDDPDCTDPSHNHDRQQTTAATRFGITTFVYARRRPFMLDRFRKLFESLPFSPLAHKTTKRLLENFKIGADDYSIDEPGPTPFDSVVRSKGFMWLADESRAALYWSQAGKQIEVSAMGQWWASVDRARWPQDYVDTILQDCEGEWGDRRQELVFIGAHMDQQKIIDALDACLATDEEMAELKREAVGTGETSTYFAEPR